MREQEVMNVLVGAIVEVRPDLQGRGLQAHDSLQALGVNSMERAEIVIDVLRELELKIALIDTFGPANLGELAALLAARCDVA